MNLLDIFDLNSTLDSIHFLHSFAIALHLSSFFKLISNSEPLIAFLMLSAFISNIFCCFLFDDFSMNAESVKMNLNFSILLSSVFRLSNQYIENIAAAIFNFAHFFIFVFKSSQTFCVLLLKVCII